MAASKSYFFLAHRRGVALGATKCWQEQGAQHIASTQCSHCSRCSRRSYRLHHHLVGGGCVVLVLIVLLGISIDIIVIIADGGCHSSESFATRYDQVNSQIDWQVAITGKVAQKVARRPTR